jgi:hypothetical protein
MKRTSLSRPRAIGITNEHVLVPACRAEGAQDIEARMRVLEEQREHDHSSFVQMASETNHMAEYIRNMETRHATHLQELEQRYKEVVSSGMKSQRDLMATGCNVKDLEGNVSNAMALDVHNLSELDGRVQHLNSATQSAFHHLNGCLRVAFAEVNANRNADLNAIETSPQQAGNEFNSVKSFVVSSVTASADRTAPNAASASLPNASSSLAGLENGWSATATKVEQIVAEVVNLKAGQSHLSVRVNGLSGSVAAQGGTLAALGTAVGNSNSVCKCTAQPPGIPS